MIRLFTLGSVDLLDGEDAVHPVLRQPKRLALLVYLAVAGRGGFCRRDQVLALFWPETDPVRARGALNQSVHFLRRHLGSGAVLTRGADEVGIGPERVWCDANAFTDLVDAGDARSALELYRGPFLDGLHTEAPPEMERWQEARRSALEQAALDAAARLAEEAEQAGALEAAVYWARFAAERAWHDESTLRRLLILLARTDDRAGLTHAFQTATKRLGEELGEEVSPQTRELYQHLLEGTAGLPLRSKGSGEDVPQAAGEPEPQRMLVRGGPVSVPLPLHRGSGPGEAVRPDQPRFTRRTRGLAAGVGALVAAVGLLWIGRGSSTSESGVLEEESARVVMDSLQVVGPGSEARSILPLLSLALAEELGRYPALRVIAPGHGATTGEASLPGFSVRGAVASAGDSIALTVQLADGVSGEVLEGATVRVALTDPATTAERLAQSASDMIRTRIGREVELRRIEAAGVAPGARELYRRASAMEREAWHLSGATPEEELRLLWQADSAYASVEQEAPKWVEPSLGRARVTWRIFWAHLAQADTARQKEALEIGAEHVERALAKSPKSARALELRAEYRYWNWTRATGRDADERAALAGALVDLQRATTSGMAQARTWGTLSMVQGRLGNWAESYLSAQRAYEANAYMPTSFDPLVRLFTAAFELRNDALAERWCRETEARMPYSTISAHCRLSLLAWAEDLGPDEIRRGLNARPDSVRGVDVPALREARAALALIRAAALARVGEQTEARTILNEVRGAFPDRRELFSLEAAAWLALGEREEATTVLLHHADRVRPLSFIGQVRRRNLAALQNDPRLVPVLRTETSGTR